MSTIRIFIYALEKYTLQTRNVSFLDHEISLKEVVVRLALFMNVETRNPCQCPKYGMIYMSDMYRLQIRKKHLKNEQELKFTFQIIPLLNNHQYQHCPKI